MVGGIIILHTRRKSHRSSYCFNSNSIQAEPELIDLKAQSTHQRNNRMTFPHVESMPVLHTGEEEPSERLQDKSRENEKPTMPHAASTMFLSDMEEEEDVVRPHVGYKKVLVTGGAGFIGSSVAEHLLARGDDVVIIDEMNDYCT